MNTQSRRRIKSEASKSLQQQQQQQQLQPPRARDPSPQSARTNWSNKEHHEKRRPSGRSLFFLIRRWSGTVLRSRSVSDNICLCIAGFSFLILTTTIITSSKLSPLRNGNRAMRRQLRPTDDDDAESTPISIQKLDLKLKKGDIGGWMIGGSVHLPTKPVDSARANKPNMGDLNIQKALNFRREIPEGAVKDYETWRTQTLALHNKAWVSPETVRDEDLEDVAPGECRRQNWMYTYHPSCNAIHEINVESNFDKDRTGLGDEQMWDSFYISHGYFRDAWLVENMPSHENAKTVLKINRYKFELKQSNLDVALRDALIMEKLSRWPQIVDLYGHCGTAIWVEAISYEVEEYIVPGEGYIAQKDLHDEAGLNPQNDYTVTEKLTMALEMAESIAILHGNEDGLIIHDDVQLCQWLRKDDGTLKLGDFNRAEIPLYNVTSGEYCKYKNGEAYGNYRSPEEFADHPLTEKLDVFSFGNNLYALLTGLWVFYENEDDDVVHKKLTGGDLAYIDPRYEERSVGEKRLVELTRRCWEFDPKKRIDIFESVEFLREALKENAKIVNEAE